MKGNLRDMLTSATETDGNSAGESERLNIKALGEKSSGRTPFALAKVAGETFSRSMRLSGVWALKTDASLVTGSVGSRPCELRGRSAECHRAIGDLAAVCQRPGMKECEVGGESVFGVE